MIDTYLSTPDTNLESSPNYKDGVYNCKEEYEKHKAGQETTLFDSIEKEINEMVVDYLFVHKGEALPE